MISDFTPAAMYPILCGAIGVNPKGHKQKGRTAVVYVMSRCIDWPFGGVHVANAVGLTPATVSTMPTRMRARPSCIALANALLEWCRKHDIPLKTTKWDDEFELNAPRPRIKAKRVANHSYKAGAMTERASILQFLDQRGHRHIAMEVMKGLPYSFGDEK